MEWCKEVLFDNGHYPTTMNDDGLIYMNAMGGLYVCGEGDLEDE